MTVAQILSLAARFVAFASSVWTLAVAMIGAAGVIDGTIVSAGLPLVCLPLAITAVAALASLRSDSK